MGLLTPTPYAALADVFNRAIPQAAVTALTTQQQQACLDASNAEADALLRARFQLPLTSWDNILVQHICAKAALRMLIVRGFNPDDGDDDIVQKAAKEASDWYKGVADGLITPNVVDSSVGISGDSGSRFANQVTVTGGVPSPNNASLSLGYGPPNTTVDPVGFVTVGSPTLRGY